MTMQRYKKNVMLLAASQALLLSAGILAITMGGLVGHRLAADKSLATLPITLI